MDTYHTIIVLKLRRGFFLTDVCTLPAEPGRCLAKFPRFHFDARTKQCIEFTYGGCEGNSNNFATIEECQKTCSHHTGITPPPGNGTTFYEISRVNVAPTCFLCLFVFYKLISFLVLVYVFQSNLKKTACIVITVCMNLSSSLDHGHHFPSVRLCFKG